MVDMDIVTLPKKGDLSISDNYRGISMFSIVPKTVNRLILNGIQNALDNKLRTNQNSFRPKRSTSAHILALQRIIEGGKSKESKSCSVIYRLYKRYII